MKKPFILFLVFLFVISNLGMVQSANDNFSIGLGANDITMQFYDANNQNANSTNSTKAIADGNLTTAYTSNSKAREGNIVLKFPSNITFNKIYFVHNFRTILEFSLEKSNDGVTFTEFYKSSEMVINEKYCYFQPQTSKYIRMNILKTGNRTETSYYGIDIYEFQVFNETTPNLERINSSLSKADEIVINNGGYTYDANKKTQLATLVSTVRNYLNGSTVLAHQVEDYKLQLDNLCFQVHDMRIYSNYDYENVNNRARDTLIDKRKEQDSQGVANINSLIDRGITAQTTMIKNNTSKLWANLPTRAEMEVSLKSNPIRDIALLNIRCMTIAATNEYSQYKGNPALISDIEYALTIFDRDWYSSDHEWFGSNLWLQMNGIPPMYADVLIMLKGVLPDNRLNYFASRLGEEIKDDYMLFTGVNRFELAMASAKVGLILKQPWRLDNLNKAVSEDLIIKNSVSSTKIAGFYSDGSYLFHYKVPYIGTYGLLGFPYYTNTLEMFASTPFAISEQETRDFLIFAVEKAIAPLIINGDMMSMVNGRAVTRWSTEKNGGVTAVNTIMDIGDALGEPYKTKYSRLVKLILEKDTEKMWETKGTYKVRNVMANQSILPLENTPFNKAYNFMDRVVHNRPNYRMGLSMSSRRIIRYEQMNENLKGWFTGAGMIYFYNTDDKQYDDKFWFIADMNRLPGTTIVKIPMPLDRFLQESHSSRDFAGGVSLDNLYGVAGLEIDQYSTDLMGRKSYFMFDDEVVCLGSNINSSINANVETIIDNRVILDNQTNNLFVNGTNLNVATLTEHSINNVKSIYLKGRTLNAQMCYVFFTPQRVTFNKEYVTKQSDEVTLNNSTVKTFSGTTANFYLNHGTAPTNAKYEYAIIPTKTLAETTAYANSPHCEILLNSEKTHAVKEKNLNIIGINNFTSEQATAGGVTLNKKCSFIMQDKGSNISIAVSDPTMMETGNMRVTIDKVAKSVVSKSDKISVVSLSPKIVLDISLSNSNGEGIEINLLSDMATVVSTLSYENIPSIPIIEPEILDSEYKEYLKQAQSLQYKIPPDITKEELKENYFKEDGHIIAKLDKKIEINFQNEIIKTNYILIPIKWDLENLQ